MFTYISRRLHHVVGWDSFVCQYGDSLRAWWSGDRSPVVARFFVPFQTGPGSTQPPIQLLLGPFPGVKRPGLGVNHPPTSSAEAKDGVELYFFPSGPSWPVWGWKLLLHDRGLGHNSWIHIKLRNFEHDASFVHMWELWRILIFH